MRRPAFFLLLLACCSFVSNSQHAADKQSLPGSRSVMDAHNCYPYDEWWYDRIDRALSVGTPVAIEQDLVVRRSPRSSRQRS